MRSSDVIMSIEYNFGVSIHSPSVPYEAMGVGKAILLSNEIKGYNFLKDVENCWRINPGDTKTYANTLNSITENKAQIIQQGKNNRCLFEKMNDYDYYINKGLDFYNTIIDSYGKHN